MPVFPHLKDTQFPDVANVDVYKYRNNFDYSRYNDTQMHLMLCSVPWDMGEAHIGNRTISGIGNVVWFETEAKRDAWFDAIPDDKCIRFDTKYKELHRDNQIVLPVPFDVACSFNYLTVEYEPFTSEDELIQYETNNGLNKWFWFVREVEFIAPNATKIHLLNDAFQTFMYRLHISNMILERGHAPLFAIDVDDYLSRPIDHNTGLLAEDVNFGNEPCRVKSTRAHVFNDDCYAVFACTSAPDSEDWGIKANDNWETPSHWTDTVNGAPAYCMFACSVANLNTLLREAERTYPQFKQTVKGIFFAPKELITLGSSFTFATVTCSWVSTSQKQIELIEIDKSMFNYPARYANIAKLYTFPYACIQVTDENGNTDVIKIEDTNGTLNINAALSLAFPAISIQTHLTGFGSILTSNLTFTNISSHSLTIGGRWYETIHQWDVPVFGIIQSSAKKYDYDSHFDRAQQNTALTNEYASSTASAATNLTNAHASADTDKGNADRSANTITANAGIQTAANSSITSTSNAAALTDKTYANLVNQAIQAWDAGFSRATTNDQVNAEYASAAIGAAGGMANSAASGMMSAGPGGAVTGLITGAISGVTSVAQTAVMANLKYSQSEAAITLSQHKVDETSQNNTDRTDNQNTANTANTTTNNGTISGTAANNAATQISNAADTQTTSKANATRTYNTDVANAGRTRSTAQSAIANGIKQAALGAPYEYGTFANTAQATTKPMALLANIVTQSDSAIAQTGDEFLRYGYYYNRQWNFNGNWNIGKYFTYWKLADFWVTGLNIPDMYVDKLRFFLYGGVTVWRKPEYIGNVGIYDNWTE